MKTRFLTAVILLSVCVTLCGCSIFSAPLGQLEVPNNQGENTVRIYICGAVEREGYYEAEVGTDYFDVLRLAGILPQKSVLPVFISDYVDGTVTNLIIGYYDGTNHDSINANSILIARRLPVKGLDENVVNKLADFIEIHGKISNKKQIESALGDDYADNYYKLYVAEIDYEEAD